MDLIASILPDIISGFLFTVRFVIVLSILVFVHEFGHYWVARRCGVRIEVFSIGFGRELFGWYDKSGTRWRFSLIPLGGYVKMFGDADPTSMQSVEAGSAEEGTGDWAEGQVRTLSEEEKAVSFHHKPLKQRTWIVAAGPLANFILAIIILAGLFSVVGRANTPPVVSSVMEGSAAEAAGFQAGDRFLEINGSKMDRFEDVVRAVELDLGAPLEVVVERDGQELELTAVPRIVKRDDGSEAYRLGVFGPQRVVTSYDPLTATWLAMNDSVILIDTTIRAVGQMIRGDRGLEELGGPVRIAELTSDAWDISPETLLFFMAVLSLNLGLINLFPIPMLDGGHLLFYGIEALRGRPLGEKAQEFGFRIGFALVLTLIVFVTWNDLTRLDVFDFF